ncbi:hypothetical protein DFH09DRAFT_359776 [Mycena vulgaris]|nr:hypothetical protein DFH09DRAFT_359776 [Mycena vulgaris]
MTAKMTSHCHVSQTGCWLINWATSGIPSILNVATVGINNHAPETQLAAVFTVFAASVSVGFPHIWTQRDGMELKSCWNLILCVRMSPLGRLQGACMWLLLITISVVELRMNFPPIMTTVDLDLGRC